MASPGQVSQALASTRRGGAYQSNGVAALFCTAVFNMCENGATASGLTYLISYKLQLKAAKVYIGSLGTEYSAIVHRVT